MAANRNPWLSEFEPDVVALFRNTPYEDRVRRLSALAEGARIRNSLGGALRFVTAAGHSCAQKYESRTYCCGEVTTRDNLHDFYNALVWLAFPCSKNAINALHVEEFACRQQVPGRRGMARDAATIFDENGMIFLTDSAWHADALRAMSWPELLHARTRFARHCRPLVFGHALLEKLEVPYKSICAHAWVIETTHDILALPRSEQRAWVDSRMAQAIAHRRVCTAALAPLPVLGIPGWCDANCDRGFYLDAQVFRRSRGPLGGPAREQGRAAKPGNAP